MKNLLILGLAVCMISLFGCTKQETPKDTAVTEPATAVETSMESTKEPAVAGNPTEQAVAATPTTEIPLDEPVIIHDPATWKHPIKPVIEGFGLKIKKVELYQDKTYPIFFVESFESAYNSDTAASYIAFLKSAAKANSYWDFAIQNQTMDQMIQVACNKSQKKVESIKVDGKKVDLDSAIKPSENNHTATEEEAIQYLLAQVPEISTFNKTVEDYSKANNTPGNKPILRVDSSPNPSGTDPYEKNFYFIYIGESTDDHTNRWGTFLVRQDLQEILVDDPVTGQYIGLDAWRRSKGN